MCFFAKFLPLLRKLVSVKFDGLGLALPTFNFGFYIKKKAIFQSSQLVSWLFYFVNFFFFWLFFPFRGEVFKCVQGSGSTNLKILLFLLLLFLTWSHLFSFLLFVLSCLVLFFFFVPVRFKFFMWWLVDYHKKTRQARFFSNQIR